MTWAIFWHSRGANIPPAVYKPLTVHVWQRRLKRQVTRSAETLKPSWTNSSTTNLNQAKWFIWRKKKGNDFISYATSLSISIWISDWIGLNCCWICRSTVRPSKVQANQNKSIIWYNKYLSTVINCDKFSTTIITRYCSF